MVFVEFQYNGTEKFDTYHFIIDIFNQFGMANCKPTYTPLPKGFTLGMNDNNFSLRSNYLLNSN